MDNSEYIDFEKEIQEFIDKKYLLNVEVLEKTMNACKFKLTTLENQEFDVICSVFQGIQIVHTTNEQNFPLTFESFEQLLGKYSPEYIKKFSNELCEKLQTIKNTQELKIEDEKQIDG